MRESPIVGRDYLIAAVLGLAVGLYTMSVSCVSPMFAGG